MGFTISQEFSFQLFSSAERNPRRSSTVFLWPFDSFSLRSARQLSLAKPKAASVSSELQTRTSLPGRLWSSKVFHFSPEHGAFRLPKQYILESKKKTHPVHRLPLQAKLEEKNCVCENRPHEFLAFANGSKLGCPNKNKENKLQIIPKSQIFRTTQKCLIQPENTQQNGECDTVYRKLAPPKREFSWETRKQKITAPQNMGQNEANDPCANETGTFIFSGTFFRLLSRGPSSCAVEKQ